jgi:hypothetical protein
MSSMPANALTQPQDIGKLRNQMLDTLFFIMCAIGLPTFTLAQWRAQDLGWSAREPPQRMVYAALLWATWSHQCLTQRFKASFQIRDDAGAWKQLELYISTHSAAQFSHGICPGSTSKGMI